MVQDWISLAKTLPVGQKTRRDCPACGEGTNTNAAIVNHQAKGYSLYCNACGYNPFEAKGVMTLKEIAELKELNDAAAEYLDFDIKCPAGIGMEDPETPWEARHWLYKAGLHSGDFARLGARFSKELKRVILPVYDDTRAIIWYQARAVFNGQKPKYIQPSAGRDQVVYEATPDTGSTRDCILCEDILSAYCVGKFVSAYSLLGTKFHTGQFKEIAKHDRVFTWLDADRAGVTGARDIRRAIGMLREVGNIRTADDPKLLNRHTIEEVLCQHKVNRSLLMKGVN